MVTISMSNPAEETEAARRRRWQSERVKRAAEEGEQYTFTWDAIARLWICRKPDGAFYLLDEEGFCNCPDARFVCRRYGLACKHIVALTLTKLFERTR